MIYDIESEDRWHWIWVTCVVTVLLQWVAVPLFKGLLIEASVQLRAQRRFSSVSHCANVKRTRQVKQHGRSSNWVVLVTALESCQRSRNIEIQTVIVFNMAALEYSPWLNKCGSLKDFFCALCAASSAKQCHITWCHFFRMLFFYLLHRLVKKKGRVVICTLTSFILLSSRYLLETETFGLFFLCYMSLLSVFMLYILILVIHTV